MTERPFSRRELLATIVMSAATIVSAWSGFQSAKWSGIQSRAYSQADANRTESVRASTAAGQQAVVDATVFTSWLAAREQGDSRLAALLEERFREEFAVAFNDWLATDPLANPEAPPTPFALPSYRLKMAERAEVLDTRAQLWFREALRANQRSDNYVLMTVMAAGILFLAAISTRFKAASLERAGLAVASVALLAALVVVAAFPKEI